MCTLSAYKALTESPIALFKAVPYSKHMCLLLSLLKRLSLQSGFIYTPGVNVCRWTHFEDYIDRAVSLVSVVIR